MNFRAFCLFSFSALFLVFFFMACGNADVRFTFEVEGIHSSPSGEFFTSKGFRIQPQTIQLVLGDFSLQKESPTNNFQVFPSLPSLLPDGSVVPSADIGKNGSFPGVWLVDITPNKEIFRFPSGSLSSLEWQGIHWRMLPAVSGVRGLSSQDKIHQNTIYFSGRADKEKTTCLFSLRFAFENGLAFGQKMSLEAKQSYRLKIRVDYQTWLHSIDFSTICTHPNQELEISDSSFPELKSPIQNALQQSFLLQLQKL